MSRPDNPRFPHWCKIWRAADEGPLSDQPEYDPLADEDYDPLADDDETDETGSEETDASDGVTVIYEGECRAYDKNTTSDKGDIIISYRGLALPITRDGWTELGFAPQEGDYVTVDRGCSKEYGSVIDKNPGNFGGTHIIWKYGRN